MTSSNTCFELLKSHDTANRGRVVMSESPIKHTRNSGNLVRKLKSQVLRYMK